MLAVPTLSAGREPWESRTPKRTAGVGVGMEPGLKPEKAKGAPRGRVAPAPSGTGDPAIVKYPAIMSAEVVAQVNRAEPGAIVTEVLACDFSQVAESGGVRSSRSPSAKLSFMTTSPSGDVT